MSQDQEDPVEKFFRTPDVVEKILQFLPSNSILSLAQSRISCVLLQLLQRSSVWDKLVKRTLGLTDYSLDEENIFFYSYWETVEERLEEERVKILELIDILKKMDAENSRAPIQHLLDSICSKSPPKERSMMKINLDGGLAVNTLCFLLLEEVEGAFGSTIQHVVSFTADGFRGGCIDQLMLRALANRVSRQQKPMTMLTQCKEVQLTSKESAEALLTLASAGVLGRGFDIMEISWPIEAAGWSALAKAITLVPEFLRVITVNSVHFMTDGKREDIRRIWENLTGDGMAVLVMDPFNVFEASEGEGLEGLEQLLDRQLGI